MKALNMPTENFTGPEAAAGAAAGWKLLAGLAGGTGIAAALATFVVMCMSRPRDDREWRVALVCTLMSSICGGAAVVRWLGLHLWAGDLIGVVGLIGVVFACGLPGWAIVRWLFNWMQKRQDKDLAEVARDFKDEVASVVVSTSVTVNKEPAP